MSKFSNKRDQENAAFAERAKCAGALPLFILSGQIPAIFECVKGLKNPERNYFGSYSREVHSDKESSDICHDKTTGSPDILDFSIWNNDTLCGTVDPKKIKQTLWKFHKNEHAFDSSKLQIGVGYVDGTCEYFTYKEALALLDKATAPFG